MINKYCTEIESEIISIRRKIHENPELEFEEFETADLICKTLDKWNIPYTRILATGIAADIGVNKNGKNLLLRADIDALPITENTGLPFSSKKSGYMHACGHDVHTAVLLGCAYVLNNIRDKLGGGVRLVFQPAEEGKGGALPMINKGVLDNISAAAALHVSADAQAGQIMLKNGAVMASIDEFDIVFEGRGGHGGHPDETVDPIVTAAEFITSVQTIVSRNVPPCKPAVISVTSINGGGSYNVIPDNVHIRGTIRCTDTTLRSRLSKLVSDRALSIAQAYGGNCTFTLHPLYPSTISNPEINALIASAAEKIIGKENIIYFDECSMGGDDFAYFCEKVPAAYFNLGIANTEKGYIHPIHSSEFAVDESAIKVGYSVMSRFAVEYLGLK